jgi:glyoxalase family protein
VKLDGIHHITAITADAQQNVDFYVGVMGLRLVKKSVNQDETSVYHLFYGDEAGDAGADLTFFEYPGVPRGRAGAGMIHRIIWRLKGPDAIEFWAKRLADHGFEFTHNGDALVFDDPEGLTHEVRVADTTDEPLIAEHPEIPADMALQGFHAVRAYAADPDRSRSLLEDTLGFSPATRVGPQGRITTREVRGDNRGGFYAYEPPPPERGLQGAGTVHHVAWASRPEDHEAWHKKVLAAGAHATPIIDRYYFRSIYFREPSGVLFEIATIGPGFTVDEPLESLGQKLSLTPQYEHLRAQIEPTLTPLRNPRDSWTRK